VQRALELRCGVAHRPLNTSGTEPDVLDYSSSPRGGLFHMVQLVEGPWRSVSATLSTFLPSGCRSQMSADTADCILRPALRRPRRSGTFPAVATSKATAKRLFALSCNICAYPGCETKLSKREWPSVMARECHIRAQRPGGARFDPEYLDVHGFDNIILMCPSCHEMVDVLEQDEWTVERLEDLKATHEQRCEDGSRKKWWSDTSDETDESRLDWLAASLIRISGTPDVVPPLTQDRPTPPPDQPASSGEQPPRVRESNDIVYLSNPNRSSITVLGVQAESESRSIMVVMDQSDLSMPPGHEIEVARMARAMGDSGVPILHVLWRGADGVEQRTNYPLSP